MLWFLIACGPDPYPTEVQTDKENYIVSYSNESIPLNEEYSLLFQIMTPDREPVQPFSVEVDAAMPTHEHGMNQLPTVSHNGDSYQADGMLFMMEGYWEIYIYILSEEGTVEQATFPHECCS